MSATPKFTPGPWFWIGNQLRTRAAMGRADSARGWLVEHDAQLRSAEGDVNRSLIAAAPNLYEALSELLAEADERARSERVPMGTGPDFFPRRADTPGEEMARAALALASP